MIRQRADFNPASSQKTECDIGCQWSRGYVFDSNDVAQDHEQMMKMMQQLTSVGVVITELPQSGQLYYDNQLIDASDVTTFSGQW